MKSVAVYLCMFVGFVDMLAVMVQIGAGLQTSAWLPPHISSRLPMVCF
jgi:hypothetical protein